MAALRNANLEKTKARIMQQVMRGKPANLMEVRAANKRFQDQGQGEYWDNTRPHLDRQTGGQKEGPNHMVGLQNFGPPLADLPPRRSPSAFWRCLRRCWATFGALRWFSRSV